jgi:hypothetical protein
LPAEAQITPRARSAAPERGDLVERAAQLEREHRLLVLAFQQHQFAEPFRQPRRALQRRLDRDVVDARLEHATEVVGGHRRRGGRYGSDGGRRIRHASAVARS